MSPLTLAPLPSPRSDHPSHSWQMEEDGFVAESVVQAVMLIQSSPFRRQCDPNDLALAADDLDFAGWHSPRQTLPPLSVLQGDSPSPEIAKATSIAFVPSPVTRISRSKAPAPIENHRWIPICAGLLILALSFALLASLAAERDFTFQSIVKKIFHLPTAAEKFETETSTQLSKSARED